MLSPSIKHGQKTEMEYILPTIKALFFVSFAALIDWLLPVKTFVGATMVLVCADLVTGIQAANKRGEIVHSKGLRRTVLKFTMYVVAMLSAHAMQTVYFPDFPMVFGISAYISATELWSILENVGTVTGVDVLSSVRGFLGKVLNKDK